MSPRVVCQYVFSCPHIDCKFKKKKFVSIEALNMHWTKIHSKDSKLHLMSNGRVCLRIK